jgi:ribonuclease Z
VFDCADGTLNRLMQSPLRVANITRIFITHMHADHVLGLVWVLAHVLSGIGTTEESREKVSSMGVNKKVSLINGLELMLRQTSISTVRRD